MFSRNKFYGLIISAFVVNVANAYAVSVADASANAANLSLNVASQPANAANVSQNANALVSPSQAKAVAPTVAPVAPAQNSANRTPHHSTSHISTPQLLRGSDMSA